MKTDVNLSIIIGLLVAVAAVALLAFRFPRMARFSKIIFCSFLVLIAGMGVFLMWKLQPWMRDGKAVCISFQHLGNCDFEVWQRKNPEMWEPFATGLFVRKDAGSWRAYLLDLQDTYHPRVTLKRQNSEVVIIHGGRRLGIFDEANQSFKRQPGGASDPGTLIEGKPPGDWWLN